MSKAGPLFDFGMAQRGRFYPELAGSKEKGSTSEQAAVAIESEAKTLRRACLEIVRHYGPISTDEAARMLQRSVLSVRPRFSELRAQRLIEPSNERTENESGMTAKRWRLVESAA